MNDLPYELKFLWELEFSEFTIGAAAALWCGVPGDLVDTVLIESESFPFTSLVERHRRLLKHSQWPDLENKYRILLAAIDAGELPATRRGASCYLLNGLSLREWFIQRRKEEKPDFLFNPTGGAMKSQPDPETVDQKTRTSYLVIIAALCKKSKIDWDKEGATSKIATALDEIGIPMAKNTIRKILKEISEAIDSRSK